MIDINELRRLAQEAMHPVTKGRWMRLFGERTVYDRMEDGCRGIPVVSTPVSPPFPFEAACLDFIAAANPAVTIELLDRLEAAEKDITIKEEVIDSLAVVVKRFDAQCDAAEAEAIEQSRLNGMGASREAALLAKLEAAEKERDFAKTEIARLHDDIRELTDVRVLDEEDRDRIVAWLQGTSTKPAPSVPDGWLRAIDEALVVAHLGVAEAEDGYEEARRKLNELICWHVTVATDPAVNGGWKLMPVEPTKEIYECFSAYDGTSYSNPFDFDDFRVDYGFALEAAPEAKP